MSHRRKLLAAAGGLALVGLVLVLRRPAADLVLRLGELVQGLGFWGPVAYVGLFVVSVPLCVPAAPLLVLAGVLFGATAGMAWATVGNLLGGALAFLLGRRGCCGGRSSGGWPPPPPSRSSTSPCAERACAASPCSVSPRRSRPG